MLGSISNINHHLKVGGESERVVVGENARKDINAQRNDHPPSSVPLRAVIGPLYSLENHVENWHYWEIDLCHDHADQ